MPGIKIIEKKYTLCRVCGTRVARTKTFLLERNESMDELGHRAEAWKLEPEKCAAHE